MKIICIDFDGVIHSYKSGWKGVGVITDPPVEGAKEWLQSLIDDSAFDPQIYSSRSKEPEGVVAMKKYIDEMGIDSSKLKFPTQKPPAFLTIDDRAMCFTGKFPGLWDMSHFKPWNKK